MVLSCLQSQISGWQRQTGHRISSVNTASLTLKSTVVIICTICFNNHKICTPILHLCGSYDSRVKSDYFVRVQVFTEASTKTTAFWIQRSRSLVEADRRFRGTYDIHHQGKEAISLDERISSFIQY
jgi:hypothetical protein